MLYKICHHNRSSKHLISRQIIPYFLEDNACLPKRIETSSVSVLPLLMWLNATTTREALRHIVPLSRYMPLAGEETWMVPVLVSRWLYSHLAHFCCLIAGPTICRSHASAQSPDFYWVRYAQMYSLRTHKHTFLHKFVNSF